MTSRPWRPDKVMLGFVALGGLALLSGCGPLGDAGVGAFLQDFLLSAMAAFLL